MKLQLTTTALLAALICSTAASADAVWDGGGGDTLWNTANNWDGDAVPTTSDDALIPGLGGTLTTVVDVNAPAIAEQLGLGGAGAQTVTLNVNDTLTYYDAFDTRDFGDSDDTITVNINSGGTLDGGKGGTSSRIGGYVTINVNAGGTLTNIYRQRLDPDIVLNGGTFLPTAGVTGARVGAYGLNNGLVGGSSGTIVIAADGDDSELSFGVSSGATLDIANLVIQFDFIDGYVPEVGHSYDILNSSGTAIIGDGSQVSSLSRDGQYLIDWDTSAWNPGGVNPRGQIIVAGVTEVAVPEPASIALLGAGGLLCLGRRRRQS